MHQGTQMRLSSLILTVLLILSACQTNQGQKRQVSPNSLALPPKSLICPKNDCRGYTIIRLKRKDGTTYEQTNSYVYPVVQSIGVTIFPGEEIFLKGTFVDNELTNITALDISKKKDAVLSFKFEQINNGSMLLTTNNYGKYDIKYHLHMMPLDDERMLKTSSCPVLSGMATFESWPHPIYQLLINTFKIVEINDKAKCEY